MSEKNRKEEITERFIEAIDQLIARGKLKTILKLPRSSSTPHSEYLTSNTPEAMSMA